MSRQVGTDKTRLAVAITSKTYRDLAQRAGRYLGEYVERAVRAELDRENDNPRDLSARIG